MSKLTLALLLGLTFLSQFILKVHLDHPNISCASSKSILACIVYIFIFVLN